MYQALRWLPSIFRRDSGSITGGGATIVQVLRRGAAGEIIVETEVIQEIILPNPTASGFTISTITSRLDPRAASALYEARGVSDVTPFPSSAVPLSSEAGPSAGQTSTKSTHTTAIPDPTSRTSGRTTDSSTRTTSQTSNADNSPTATSLKHHKAATAQSNSTGLSTGAKAGIGVGVAVGVLLLIALITFFVLRKRRRNSPREVRWESEKQETSGTEAAGVSGLGIRDSDPNADATKAELSSTRDHAELDGIARPDPSHPREARSPFELAAEETGDGGLGARSQEQIHGDISRALDSRSPPPIPYASKPRPGR